MALQPYLALPATERHRLPVTVAAGLRDACCTGCGLPLVYESAALKVATAVMAREGHTPKMVCPACLGKIIKAKPPGEEVDVMVPVTRKLQEYLRGGQG